MPRALCVILLGEDIYYDVALFFEKYNSQLINTAISTIDDGGVCFNQGFRYIRMINSFGLRGMQGIAKGMGESW